MGASVLSKVTPVSQEASLLLSRSKEDSVSLFYSWGVYESSCHGDEQSRRGSVALLTLFSLLSFSLRFHSGGTSVSAAYEEAAVADKQLSAL